ncbi:MAG: hypothetical protein INR70_21240, partial [Parafilimonas terrae]|nr:hypothetical protein [Parafilimonas terrae]
MASDIAVQPTGFAPASQSFTSVGRDVGDIAFEHPLRLRWWIAFAASLGLVGLLVFAIGYLLYA